ncbi:MULTISPECIES: DUF1642 domain-containing protein [Streptococcus]|uniref:DUF1642 domain-containing protein n=1 Tax=Streptococcus TaxID=1301 RepID=UPI001105EA4D|nr:MULTISPECIES: DUF1642 domain-containing protein [Streptococcus]
MNVQRLIEKYKKLEGVWDAEGAELARQIFLQDLEQLDEPKPVEVPQFVADWIEEARKACKDVGDFFEFNFTNDEVGKWFMQEQPFDLVARAWLDGYEVEEEKRYYVRFKWIEESYSYLTLIKHLDTWTLTNIKLDKKFRSEHTRKQLEDAGFGWVFDCEGVEVEEVE